MRLECSKNETQQTCLATDNVDSVHNTSLSQANR